MTTTQNLFNLTQEKFNEIFIGGNPKVDDEENVKYKLYTIYKNLLKITGCAHENISELKRAKKNKVITILNNIILKLNECDLVLHA